MYKNSAQSIFFQVPFKIEIQGLSKTFFKVKPQKDFNTHKFTCQTERL